MPENGGGRRDDRPRREIALGRKLRRDGPTLAGPTIVHFARLALLLLFAGGASAQLSCAREEELVANLRWVRKACEQEGEALPEGDEDTLRLVFNEI